MSWNVVQLFVLCHKTQPVWRIVPKNKCDFLNFGLRYLSLLSNCNKTNLKASVLELYFFGKHSSPHTLFLIVLWKNFVHSGNLCSIRSFTQIFISVFNFKNWNPLSLSFNKLLNLMEPFLIYFYWPSQKWFLLTVVK